MTQGNLEPKFAQKKEGIVNILIKCLPILSFTIPFGVLYSLYPGTYEMTWEGRTYYLFFLWLMLLETILNWEKLQTHIRKLKSRRTVVFMITLCLPTIYVVGANFFGGNEALLQLALRNNVPFSNFMPLSIEYLVFTVFFVLIAFAQYGLVHLENYSITAVFLGAIGAIYTINNLFPYGQFTPFQIFVPTTTMLASAILNMMGYQTNISYSYTPQEGSLPVLSVQPPSGSLIGYKIAWPCSGVESLIIYSITILLFLKNSSVPWKQKTVYFVFGAVVTYFINALRIVTIFLIATGGGGPEAVSAFHDYYGQLYSISWILSYPLIILASRALWGKIITVGAGLKQDSRFSGPVNVPVSDLP